MSCEIDRIDKALTFLQAKRGDVSARPCLEDRRA
jgi:hypothetical protein